MKGIPEPGTAYGVASNIGALAPTDCEPSQMRKFCVEPTARYRVPFESLQLCNPLIGSAPVWMAGVITAAVPDVLPETTIVGVDVKSAPAVTIVAVLMAPFKTVYVPLNELPPPPVAVSVPLPEYPVPAVVIVSTSTAPFLTIWVGASRCHPPMGRKRPSEKRTRLPWNQRFFA